MPAEERLADEPWRVDWTNECVWHGDAMVRLPPKAFAVLRLLMEQAGQLVTKEALLEVIWPDAVVSEAVLTVCIGELRKALRETAQAPRFIQTVHRRGYRFIGHLPTVVPSTHPPAPLSPPRSASPAPLLVGREREFTHLHQCLGRVRQGARQTVFLAGEPGMGKTAIVNAFVEELANAGDVWLARGQCIEHYGVSEAYLPILEALGRLCREPGGAALLPVLEQHAPTWLVQMPALLSAAAFATVQRRILGATQERMVRELAEAVEVLTVTRPLLLVLEDLHWSDYATLELLTYLARRAGPARLLVLGTYRPVEVLLRRHPLAAVTQELVLHGQAMELPLELLTASEVAQYLALRCTGGTGLPPACRGLAPLLHQRTDGHPLFLVTVVEHLLQRGVLREVAGQWEVQSEAAAVAMEVPMSVRQLIEQQFAQLTPEEQRVLEAASVAGHEGAMAAVAAGLELAVEAVEDCCAGLTRRGQFLVASGLETWPDGTVTERYRWQHAVHQEVVYARLPEGRRLRLHRRIGARQEAGYGAQVSERAAELAMHFEQGRDWPRAVQYLQQAAENAEQRHAPHEVIGLLTKGLELLATLPATPARAQQELALQIALGPALIATKGYGAPEVEKAYTRARELCQQGGNTEPFFTVMWGLYAFYLTRAELWAALELGEQCLALAQRTDDAALLMEAHRALGNTLFYRGEYALARAHLEQASALYDPQQHRSHAFVYAGDPEIVCLSYFAWTLWFLGYPEQALQSIHKALTLADALSHPYSMGCALNWAVRLHQYRREGQRALEQADACVTLCTEHGFTYLSAMGTVSRGWALTCQGQGEEGMKQIDQGLAVFRATGAVVHQVYLLALLAEAYKSGGQIRAALDTLAEALVVVNRTEERWYEAELHRLTGELLLQHGIPDEPEVERCFWQALTIARSQQAKSLELRAATSLSRLWQRQGKGDAARELMAPIYGWFTEGFDTADLQEARALLEALT